MRKKNQVKETGLHKQHFNFLIYGALVLWKNNDKQNTIYFQVIQLYMVRFRDGHGFSVLNVLSNYLSPEKVSQKTKQFCKTSIFKRVEFNKTPILPNYQVPNGYFYITVNFIIQELKFRKIAQLFFVSVSQVRDKMRGN